MSEQQPDVRISTDPARAAADELGLEFLGEIPLDPRTRESGDTGIPIVKGDPESEQAQRFMQVAEAVAARCSVLQYRAARGE